MTVRGEQKKRVNKCARSELCDYLHPFNTMLVGIVFAVARLYLLKICCSILIPIFFLSIFCVYLLLCTYMFFFTWIVLNTEHVRTRQFGRSELGKRKTEATFCALSCYYVLM